MNAEGQRRWRLILGKHADGRDGGNAGAGAGARLSTLDQERDEALAYLFDSEREEQPSLTPRGAGLNRRAGDGPSPLTPVTWLAKVRRIFPDSSAQTLQTTAIDRYGMTELLSDPKTLAAATPTLELAATLLSFRANLQPQVMAQVRRIIGTVTKSLQDRLSRQTRQLFGGRRRRHEHFGRPLLSNLDWRRTITCNLKHFDTDSQTLVPERLYFNPRDHRRIPWQFFLLVDQSGSMADSVIHSAVVGSAFMGLPSVTTRLFLFDTQVVDMSAHLSDPLQTLLSVQLGGGTDIAGALAAVAAEVSQPRRTVLVLVTDFDEGAEVTDLLRTVTALKESGVKLLGLAALTEDSVTYVNQTVARQVSGAGMPVGVLSPDRLAAWIADQIG